MIDAVANAVSYLLLLLTWMEGQVMQEELTNDVQSEMTGSDGKSRNKVSSEEPTDYYCEHCVLHVRILLDDLGLIDDGLMALEKL